MQMTRVSGFRIMTMTLRAWKAMADNQYQLEGNAPQRFERDTAQTLGKPLAEQVFNHVELHPGERVLDAAYGPVSSPGGRPALCPRWQIRWCRPQYRHA